MKVGDLVRGRKDVGNIVAWTGKEAAIVVKVEMTEYGVEDVVLRFPEGELVVMSRPTIEEIFEVISEAP